MNCARTGPPKVKFQIVFLVVICLALFPINPSCQAKDKKTEQRIFKLETTVANLDEKLSRVANITNLAGQKYSDIETKVTHIEETLPRLAETTPKETNTPTKLPHTYFDAIVDIFQASFMTIIHVSDAYVRPIVFLIAAGFSIYFAFKKIGLSVVAHYIVSGQTYSDTYISKLVLTNNKDKPICVWSAHAVIDNDLSIDLDTFDPPLVIKPLESHSVSLPPFTSLSIANDKYKPDYYAQNVDIYINTGSKMVKCKRKPVIDVPFRHVAKLVYNFNDHVYNENVKYILHYVVEGESQTAFIDSGGFIGNEWGFAPNSFGKADVSEDDIKQMLTHCGFDRLFSNYICYRVDFPKIKFAFRKQPNEESA
ncbi:MAG TPA: hypothetical protein VEF34_11925 [Syntrophobacteraceae bacterium]|nr:hypothetical protein [Syntrophobacteraceae bacterium]